MSFLPMSMLGAGDSHLSFKSEDDNIFPNFRLYARRDDEDDNGFRGHGAPQHPFPFPSMGSGNSMFGSADQLPMPQTTSPTIYEGEMSFSSQYFSSPQDDSPLNFSYPPQTYVGGQSHSWDDSRSSSYQLSNHEYELDQSYPYRQSAGVYSQGNFSSASSSSSGRNSYDSLPDTRYVDERRNRREETVRRIRELHNIPDGVPVNLNALPDPPHGERPIQKLATLVQLAIVGAPDHRLSLRDIYKAIEERFLFFRTGETKWQGSIRHMLSLKGEFIQVKRPMSHPGSGDYWTLDMSFVGQDKRTRKRRPRGSRSRRGTSTDSQGGDNNDDNDNDEAPVSPTGSQGSNISSHAASSSTVRHSPYHAPSRQLPTPTTRRNIRRSESDGNLPNAELESLNITTGNPYSTRSSGMHSHYIDPPPAQTPYRGHYPGYHGYSQRQSGFSSHSGTNNANASNDSVPRGPSFPLPATQYPPIPAPLAGMRDISAPEPSYSYPFMSSRTGRVPAAAPMYNYSSMSSSTSSPRSPRAIVNPVMMMMGEGSRQSSSTDSSPKDAPKDSKGKRREF